MSLEQIKQIFFNALNMPSGSDRESYLCDACGGDAELRRKVDRYLQAHENAGSFMDDPIGEVSLPTEENPITEKTGNLIGPYKLLQRLGEGGFGVVYMAWAQRLRIGL